MTELSPSEVLNSDPKWAAMYSRMTNAMLGTGSLAVGDPGLPEGGWENVTVLEKYARAITETSSPEISLALTFPMALVACSVAQQGALWLKIAQPGGHSLKVPGILQATLIAPSGYGKSNALDPLVEMMDSLNRAGITRRKKMVNVWSDAEIQKQTAKISTAKGVAASPSAGAVDEKGIRALYQFGLCKRLTLDSGTPEGIRRALLRGGGVGGIMTAEPDVLREISGYAKDGGTFRWLLDGWGGAKIGVARGDREMVVPRAALPYCIVVQPSSFDQFNQSRIEKEGGTDSAIGRGLYGRSWLVRIEGWKSAGLAFGMGAQGNTQIVGKALAGIELALEKIMRRTDEYRAKMGVVIGWEDAASRDEEGDTGVPPLPEQVWMELAPDAMFDYTMLQNVRLAFIEDVSIAEASRPGLEKILMPMVTRITQHALRLAMALQLSVDPDAEVVEKWALRDATMRLLPWLIEHWAAEMHRYHLDGMQALLEFEVRNNIKAEDLTFESRVLKALSKVVDGKGGGAEATFTRSEVIRKARDQFRSSARLTLGSQLEDAFEDLLARKWISKQGTVGTAASVVYARTPVGIANGL